MTSIPCGEYFISTGNDVTHKIKTDEFIKSSQRLGSLGAIAGGAFHDLSNLLMIVYSNTSLLKSLNEGNKYSERFDAILNACDKAGGLCQKVLSYTNQKCKKDEEIDLNEKLYKIIELLQASKQRNISINLKEINNVPNIIGNRII